MSIDWSKAPEGANKAGFTGHEYLQLYRIPGMFGDYDYWNERMGTWCGSDFPTCANHLFDRPEKVEWNGQGLPPVGTVCEIKHRDIGWVRCEIVAHKSFSCGGLTLAIAWIDENTLDQSQGVRFRPIRTPEQIAAEEREKAVGDMAMSIQGVPYQYPTLYALYDAGYRRQESST
ncbi:hypothetical protein [Pseudomonas aeruginosa]|uniref:hypothetical protein n=1 Tax=Pseudomonas aeruginosa TaxID=287 RepID=UPI003CEA85FF